MPLTMFELFKLTPICIVLCLFGCNNINPEDITIIDGVRPGMELSAFNSQLDSLKINQQIFYSKSMVTNVEEIYNSRMKFYRTDIFNSSKYSSPITQHYGMYYPISIEGTNNIVGLNILLVHTENALVITQSGMFNVTKETQIPALSQDISSGQIEDIARLLSEKYGKPIDTIHFYLNKFYVMEGMEMKTYNCDTTNIGDVLIWKTKYLNIRFFKGISSPYSTYNVNDRTYFTYFDSNPFRVMSYQKGEAPCKSYAYISYELNNDAIKKLGLNKPKL